MKEHQFGHPDQDMEEHEDHYLYNGDGTACWPSMLITELGPWSKAWKALSPFHEGVPDGMLYSDSARLTRKLAGTWQCRLSFILLRLLRSLRFPLRLVGEAVEWFLNFYSINGGFLGILFSLGFGQDIIWFPPKDSPCYYSTVGWLDPRVDLIDATAKLKEFNSKMFTDLCIMASKLAYESEAVQKDVLTNRWNMCFQKFYSCWNDYAQRNTTQAFTFSDKPEDAELVVLAFRGTEPFNTDDWSTDFDFSWYEVAPELGRIHMGFLEALGLVNRKKEQSLVKFTENCMKGHTWVNQKLPGIQSPLTGLDFDDSLLHAAETPTMHFVNDSRQDVSVAATPTFRDCCIAFDMISGDLGYLLQQHPKAKLVITGHSLGGALAVVFAGLLMFKENKQKEENGMLHRLSAIHTFGQPRVGDQSFANFMNRSMAAWSVDYYRIVYCNDIVPRMPFDNTIFGFKHCGHWCYYFDSFYRERAMQSEPNKNYFSPFFAVDMWLNAIWEFWKGLLLLRLFYGDGFHETTFSTIVRLMGLISPGVSDHSPTNYVNAICLGPKVLNDMTK